MAESFSEVASRAFQASVTCTKGGDLSFTISTDSTEVVKDLCCTAVKLGAMYATYCLVRPLIDAAVTKALGGNERDDQEVREIRPGCLHVLLRCLTDERFLEVLEDYESDKIKQCLEEELLKAGIKTKGLEIKIENIKEVEERKSAITEERRSYSTSVKTEGEVKTTKNEDLPVTDTRKLSTKKEQGGERKNGGLKYGRLDSCGSKLMADKGNLIQQPGVVVIGDYAKVVTSGCDSPPNPNATDTDGVDTGEEEVIKKVSEFIQNDYLNKYRLVSRNPVKTDKTSLQDIIVKRDLQHLDSEEKVGDFMYKIFGGDGDAHSPSRVLIVGKAFTGKSILCQKYAYDWANPDFQPPEPFNQFKIVVWLKLCEVEGTMGEILDQEVFRGRLTEVEKARFFSYMKKHPNQFLFLLDGVSECDLDKLTDIQNFLLDKDFGGVYLIATVRPHQDGKLNYAFHSRYCIPGYNKDNVFEYISKFFRKDTKKGEELKERLENNVNYMELVENPLLTLVLCEVWDEQSALPTITRFLGRYTEVVLEWFEKKRKFGEGITLQNILSSLENFAGSYLYKEEKSQFSQDELTKYKVDSRVGFFDLEMGHRSFKFSHYKLQLFFIARWIVNNWDKKQLERLLKTIPSSDPAFPTLVAGVLAEKKDDTSVQFLEALTKSTCESFIEDSCYCKRMDLFLACIAEAWTETNSKPILQLCEHFKPFRKNKTPNGFPLKMSHGAAQALGLIVKKLELDSLNLSGILIPLSAVKVIASECLQENNLLESVTFSHSCLCPDAVETVCAAFSTMHRLKEVNLSCCNFGDKGLKAVADFVKDGIGQYNILRLADHLDYHVEKEQIEHAKQSLRREDSTIQIETLSRFQEECASSLPSDKAVETLIEAFEEDVESQEIQDLSLPAPCIGTFVKRWLEVFRKFSQLKRIEIHLKELSKDLEDDLVQFVNNMLHLEKMSVVLEVEQTDRRDYSNHLSLAAKTNGKLKLTIKDHTQSVKYPVKALR